MVEKLKVVVGLVRVMVVVVVVAALVVVTALGAVAEGRVGGARLSTNSLERGEREEALPKMLRRDRAEERGK